MHAGLKAGLNISDVIEDDPGEEATNFDTKLGFVAGAYFNYQFNNMFAVQPEIYYSMKGAKLKDQYNDLNLKLTYFEIPILLQFIVPLKGTPVKPLLFVGPAMGLNLTAKNERTNNGQTTEEDYKDNVESTEFSLAFGGGISFPLGNNEIGLDVRYLLGLSNIGKNTGSATIKNTAINFNLFYAFSLK
jgi:hypothetical protein